MNPVESIESIVKRYTNNASYDKPVTNTNEYTRVHAINMKSKYILTTTVNDMLKEIVNKRSIGSVTDSYPCFINDAFNVLYVDLDYWIQSGSYKDCNETLTKLVNEYLMKYLDGQVSNSLTFICDEYPCYQQLRYKCGCHIFIYLNHVLTRESRMKLVNDLLRDINEDKNSEINKYFSKISSKIFIQQDSNQSVTDIVGVIDRAPLERPSSILIPFSKKSSQSRNYKLVYEYCNDTNCKYIQVPNEDEYDRCLSRSSLSNSIMISSNDSIKSLDELHKMKPIELRNYVSNTLTRVHVQQTPNYSRSLLEIEVYLYDFISGLSSMSDDNAIVDSFKKGKWSDNNTFINHFTRFYYSLYIMNTNSIEVDIIKYISSILYLILLPLYIRGGKTNETDILNHIQQCVTYTNISYGTYHNNVTLFNTVSNEDLMNYYMILNHQLPSRSDDIDPEVIEDSYESVKRFIMNQVMSWVTYVEDDVIDTFDNVIEPFKWNDYTRDINKFSFEQLREPSNRDHMINYQQQLRNIANMIMFCELWQYGFDTVDPTVNKILNVFASPYVYAVKDKNTRLKSYSIYIYNIKQTSSLESLPYNQWVLDNNNYLNEWITKMYNDIIVPLFKFNTYSQFGGLGCLFKCIVDVHQLRTKRIKNRDAIECLKLPQDPSLYIDYISRNIASFFKYLNDFKPSLYDPSNSKYLSVLNGIIRYEYDGDDNIRYVFTTDNKDIILNAYTVAKYEPNYDFDNYAYKKINTFFKQVYVNEVEREYMLNLFSTVFCPMIKKDQLVFAYGTGADGKSTVNKLLSRVLGNVNEEIHVPVNGIQTTYKIPKGYSGSFLPGVLMESKKGSNHDEGGIINFNQKTFMVCQEPPKGNIHSEVFKDFTSGGVTNSRNIHQGNTQFIANALCIIETNDVPKFDAIDEAVRRRVIVYLHQSKFISKSTNQYVNKDRRTVFKANEDMINDILNDPNCWTALLMMMLRRVNRLLTTKDSEGAFINSLSQIEKPDSIEHSTNSAFNKSSNLTNFLTNYVTKSDHGLVSIKLLIDKIIEADNRRYKRGNGILEHRSNCSEKTCEIKNVIQSMYPDNMFKILDSYMNTVNSDLYEFVDKLNDEPLETIRKTYTTYNTISSIDGGNEPDFSDMIILGHIFNIEKFDDDFEGY